MELWHFANIDFARRIVRASARVHFDTSFTIHPVYEEAGRSTVRTGDVNQFYHRAADFRLDAASKARANPIEQRVFRPHYINWAPRITHSNNISEII